MRSKTMAADRDGPVFIVGCPRSGTTLLRRMLDAHAAVAIAPETHFVRRFWLRRSDYGDLADDRRYRRLIDDIVALPEFAEMGIDGRGFRNAAWDIARSYHGLFGLLLDRFGRHRGARVVGEKTPNHLLYMQRLQEFFPAARFVHIIRDPRGVVLSWRHVPWSTGSVAGDAEVWRRYLATARRCPPADPDRLCEVRYEQLVTAPEENLRRVCHFLDLDFDPAMLRYDRAPQTAGHVVREPWQQGAGQPIKLEPAHRWRHELPARLVAQVEAVTWREMRYLRYRPLTPAARLWPRALSVAIKRMPKRLARLPTEVLR